MHQEVHGGMETKSIYRGSTWQFVSFQYHHNHEECDENLNNNEVEQILLQHVKTVL
jgi:hypothetical protein